MRIRTLKNCMSEGVKGIFRNGFMSLASIGTITVCLIILGIIFCLVRNVENFAKDLDDNLGVVAFMKEGITEEETQQLIERVKARSEVKQVIYVSAEEAWAKFQEELRGEGDIDSATLDSVKGNPLANSANLEIFLNRTEDQPAMVQFLENQPEIRKVNYSADASAALATFRNLITYVGMAIILFLILVALLLITNTIKLSVYIRRNEIHIMKYLGAADSYVKLPFVVEGILIGLLGAILPTALIYFGYDILVKTLNDRFAALTGLVTFLSVNDIMKDLIPIFLILSIVVGTIGGLISIRKYLKV